MKSGIYIIKNTLNNNIYVGSSQNIKKRFYTHLNKLERNVHANKKLQNSFNKNGKNTFKFLVIENVSVDLLIEREQYYIDNLKPYYNIRKKANSNRGILASDATREKMSISHKRRYKNNPKLKSKVSEFHKDNKWNLGRIPWNKNTTLTNQHKMNISQSKSTINILQLDLNGNLIKEWDNMCDIVNTTNFKNGGILRCCKNERKTYKGFIWKLKNI